MAKSELIILGSASGLPVPDRAHATLALHDGNEIHLLDAGEGACSALVRWDLDPLKVKNIFITHTHPDHCVGLFMILQYMHMKYYKQKMDIYLPGDAVPAFETFMKQLYLVKGHVNPRYDLRPLEKRHAVSDVLILETYPTRHLQAWQDLALPGLGTEAFAFRVIMKGGSLFYSGDIGDFADISDRVRRDDLLILEGAHIDVSLVLNWAFDFGLKRIVLTHVLPGTGWIEGDLLDQARRKGLDVILAQDGMKLQI